MKQRKLFAILTLVAFMMTLLPMAAFAAITGVTVTPVSNAVGQTTNYTVAFTTAEDLAIGETITITFPTGYNLSSAAVAAAGNFSAGVVDGQKITLTATAPETAGAKSITVTDVRNANLVGTYAISVATTQEAAVSANVTLVAGNGNRFNSIMSADKTSVNADPNDEVEFTVWVYDQFNNLVPSGNIYVASDRGLTDTISGSGSGEVKTVPVTAGKATFTVQSVVAGTAKIAVALGSGDVYDYLIGANDETAASVGLIGTQEISFVTTGAQNITVFEVHNRDRRGASWGTALNPVGGIYTGGKNKADNLDHYRFRVRVTNAVGAPVPNQNVDFTVNSTRARLSATTATTDANGIATVNIYATRGGNYKVTAQSSGNTTVDATFNFQVGDATEIKLVSADNRKIARNAPVNFDFEIFDSAGNKVKPGASSAAYPGVTVELIKKPSNVSFNNGQFEKGNDGSNDYLRVKLANSAYFTVEGEYTLRVSLDNGRYAETSFTIKEQGTINRITVNYKNTTLALGSLSLAPEVKTFDADNVERTIAANSGHLTFAASDTSKLKAFGDGAYFNGNRQFQATDSDKYTGDFVITVTDTTRNLVASQTITVADKFASVVAEAPAVTEVGKDAAVILKAIDVKGNTVAIGDPTVEFTNYSVVSRPAGAIVSVDAESAFAKNMREKGTARVDISSNVAGKVEVVLISTIGGTTYATPVTVEFGEPKVIVGSKNVTLFIGSTGAVVDGAAMILDVAPFIKDSRTFVPVRFVAEALGAEVKYDAATQVVTATRGNDVVVLTIGSNVFTKNGEAQVTDVAPFIAEGNRTVLPFRAIAEAFGAEVEAGFAADGTVSHVVFKQ